MYQRYDFLNQLPNQILVTEPLVHYYFQQILEMKKFTLI